MKVIYDFGANNGDDLPYYLLRADKVVAVEADPTLCSKMEDRFAQEIAQNRLHILNVCLTGDKQQSGNDMDFWVHRERPVLSSAIKPADNVCNRYDIVRVPSMTASDIIGNFGDPYYIKIDVEGLDGKIIRDLFVSEIYPPYLSAECHNAEVFGLLISCSCYESFKLVDGSSVPKRYLNREIQALSGEKSIYSFPYHSAGPFGNDIDGDWIAPNNFFKLLSAVGLGWKDIHVSRLDKPNKKYTPTIKYKVIADY